MADTGTGENEHPDAPYSLGQAWRAVCPRCRTGRILQGLLKVRAVCPQCGLRLSEHDSGDGPAFFVGFALSMIAVALVVWLEVAYRPPLWVHAILWPVFIGSVSVLALRPIKAFLIAQQYRHRSTERPVV